MRNFLSTGCMTELCYKDQQKQRYCRISSSLSLIWGHFMSKNLPGFCDLNLQNPVAVQLLLRSSMEIVHSNQILRNSNSHSNPLFRSFQFRPIEALFGNGVVITVPIDLNLCHFNLRCHIRRISQNAPCQFRLFYFSSMELKA